MDRQEELLRLLNDLKPLRISLASDPDYKKLRYSFDDVMGFLDDKIIHVFLKYKDSHSTGEIKALAIASIYRIKPRLFRHYTPRVDELKEELAPAVEVEYAEDKPTIQDLINNLSQVFTSVNVDLLSAILDPPRYVLSKAGEDSRLPSRLFLEYLDIPVNEQSVKRLNKFRRALEDFIRGNVDPKTFKVHRKHLSITY